MSMTPTELAQACLSQKLDTLEDRLRHIEHDRHRGNGALSADSQERAAERENDEVLDQLARTTLAELLQARHAMERIETGRFGRCEICGDAIGDARLHALPEATTCCRCASVPAGRSTRLPAHA